MKSIWNFIIVKQQVEANTLNLLSKSLHCTHDDGYNNSVCFWPESFQCYRHHLHTTHTHTHVCDKINWYQYRHHIKTGTSISKYSNKIGSIPTTFRCMSINSKHFIWSSHVSKQNESELEIIMHCTKWWMCTSEMSIKSSGQLNLITLW